MTRDEVGLPHLGAAAIAMGLFLVLVGFGSWYARRTIRTRVDVLAPTLSPQKNLGVAVQREMFRQPKILPVYGSSELVYQIPNRAADVFAGYPTGFAVSPVGGHATPPLVTLQQLAAVGRLMRGRKLVLFLTPDMFTRPIVRRDRASYAGNYSRLQAGELAFSPDLTFPFKEGAARQLVGHPEVLRDDPFLRVTLEGLAAGSLGGRLLYYLALPFGRLENAVLERDDEIRTLGALLRDHRPRRAAAVDWADLADQARRDPPVVAGHLFGFRSKFWDLAAKRYQKRKGSATDSSFAAIVRSSPRWRDLELILSLLGDLGADPLIISIPLHGPYMDYVGVSLPARRLYYQRLRSLTTRFRVDCLTFEEREYDPYFLVDPAHPSSKGWAAFDLAMDKFYHDAAE